MTSGYMIKIFFRDGRTEEHYCDYYEKICQIWSRKRRIQYPI